MLTNHEYQGYQIDVECKEHRRPFQKSTWSASFEYAREGQVLQKFVEACAHQKTVQAAGDKALRFAIIAIETRTQLVAAHRTARCARRAGALERLAHQIGHATKSVDSPSYPATLPGPRRFP